MIVYLVAGLVVGWLTWQFGRVGQGTSQPKLGVQVLIGAVGAVVGGLGLNLVAGRGLLDVEPWSFATATVLAMVVLWLLQVGATRRAG
jgi:uncharacterized membrane protein YeaQ/YmgE (transglycosylase-associated protein family)